MKKNSIYGLVISFFVVFQASGVGITPQEKQAMYRQLAQLEHHKRLIVAAYGKAVHRDMPQAQQHMIEQEYTKKIEDISHLIEQQKRDLEAATKQELLWRGAQFLGGAALIGLFAYNVFTAAQLPPLVPAMESISTPLAETGSVISQDQNKQLSVEEKIASDHHVEQENVSAVIDPVSLEPLQQTESNQYSKLPLTPQNKALYQLRYKNLRNAIFPPLVALLLGPPMLPIDIILLGISLASGVGATYYNEKLNPKMYPPAEGDTKINGILLDAILSR